VWGGVEWCVGWYLPSGVVVGLGVLGLVWVWWSGGVEWCVGWYLPSGVVVGCAVEWGVGCSGVWGGVGCAVGWGVVEWGGVEWCVVEWGVVEWCVWWSGV